jgi:hypothetical protein
MRAIADKPEPRRSDNGVERRGLWYVARAVVGCTQLACRVLAPCVAVAALAASGCGGGTRQDADEPSGMFRVDVVRASFPTKQRLATSQRFVITVRNADTKALPNVAVTVDSFAARSEQAGLADPSRAVWIVDDGPRGGDTAYTNTWALGRLAPGQMRQFVWRVTAVQAGTHTVKWQVAAGLNGKARATLAGNRAPAGSFTVDVSSQPAQSHVDPKSGRVVRSSR